jgi:ribosome-associated toxin RatA of RatAB toxin-antitoxin module
MGLCLVFISGQKPGAATLADDQAVPESDHRADLERLLSGEVLLETVRMDESGGAARVRALAHTSTEAIWAVIVSCEDAYRYVRGLKSCDILRDDGDQAQIHQAVKQSWVMPRLDFTFAAERSPYTSIDFHMLEGDLRQMQGSWRFEPLAEHDAVLVTHEIRVVPKFPAPRWLVRRSIGRDVPEMLACIRGLAGGSGSEDQQVQDLARCQR